MKSRYGINPIDGSVYDFAAEIEREVEERDDLITEQKNVITEMSSMIQEKDSVIQEKDQQKKLGIKKMLKSNLDIETIAEFSGITVEEAQKYITEIQKEA